MEHSSTIRRIRRETKCEGLVPVLDVPRVDPEPLTYVLIWFEHNLHEVKQPQYEYGLSEFDRDFFRMLYSCRKSGLVKDFFKTAEYLKLKRLIKLSELFSNLISWEKILKK